MVVVEASNYVVINEHWRVNNDAIYRHRPGQLFIEPKDLGHVQQPLCNNNAVPLGNEIRDTITTLSHVRRQKS